ncbi:MAG: hypothetical protein QM775_30490 [Pirellulales bacterium]
MSDRWITPSGKPNSRSGTTGRIGSWSPNTAACRCLMSYGDGSPSRATSNGAGSSTLLRSWQLAGNEYQKYDAARLLPEFEAGDDDDAGED